MNDSQNIQEKPVLLTELMGLVAKCEAVYGQKRVFNRVSKNCLPLKTHDHPTVANAGSGR